MPADPRAVPTAIGSPLFGGVEDLDVWLLEDSVVDGEFARSNLPTARVRMFTDGAALLEEIARAPVPDVVVLDWELDALTGIDVCRFLRRTHDSLALPIVMVTAHREERYVLAAFEAGANDYVVKPYPAGEFAARVLAAARAKRIYASLVDTHASLERERARVAESEARYRALAQSGVIGIIEGDLRGRLIDANAAYLAMVGLTRTEALLGGESPLDPRALRELIEHGVTAPHERELVRGDGAPVIVRVAAARVSEHLDRCVAYVLDVTHERQVEADRARLYGAERRARADAELASRMKDEFLATVSHELRTPLNAVLGWAGILAERAGNDSELAKPLEVIQRNARLQAKLIEDLLDVSRIISGKVRLEVREIDPRAVIVQAIDATRPAADARSVAIEAQIDRVLPPIAGDPDRLQQVVWNLVSNAVKYTPAGGRVVVTTTVEAHHLVIDVTDTGAGIAAENLAAIFERFRQIDGSTTRAHGGLGLGLAIVRNLVEMHGGTVSATSPGLGRGATFSVRLAIVGTAPAVVAAPPQVAEAPVVANEATGEMLLRGVTVVLVDDDADSHAFATTALTAAGAQVHGESNAADGLAAVLRLRPDVLISDISMPGQDGYSLIARLRATSAADGGRTPSIALTAHAHPDDVARCLAAGFDRHLAKPVEVGHLVRCTAECVRSGRER